ncbi:MAG: transporter [Saprospiraceae bacterium]|nr:transporter [Saprospiraceae bacterium]
MISKFKQLKLLFLLVVCMSGMQVSSQTPTDAIMMERSQFCAALTYGQDNWDEYWEGTLLRVNGNIGTLEKQTIGLMVAAGIINRLNLIVSLPYIKTNATAGQMKGVNGLQDFGIWAKYQVFDRETANGIFTIHGVAGFSTPVSNYLADYAPFSLGLGCPEGQGRLTFQHKFNMGLYARVSGAYLVRGNTTIERDFYYAGKPYYSDKVDVPNASQMTGTLGCWLFNNNLKLEGSYDIFNTSKGEDIRRQDAGFVSYKMEASTMQFQAQYYTPHVTGLGVFVNYYQVLDGRNIGKSTGFTAGLTYQFSVSNSNPTNQ